jgi:hypothetical protein
MRIQHDPRFPAEIRDSALGQLSVSATPISYTAIGAVPITIGGTYSQSEVQSVADAVREIGKIFTT